MAKKQATLYSCDKCCRDILGGTSGVVLPIGSQIINGVDRAPEAVFGDGRAELAVCIDCLAKRLGLLVAMKRGAEPERPKPPPPPEPPSYTSDPRYLSEPEHSRHGSGRSGPSGRPCTTGACPGGLVAPLAHGEAWA